MRAFERAVKPGLRIGIAAAGASASAADSIFVSLSFHADKESETPERMNLSEPVGSCLISLSEDVAKQTSGRLSAFPAQ